MLGKAKDPFICFFLRFRSSIFSIVIPKWVTVYLFKIVMKRYNDELHIITVNGALYTHALPHCRALIIHPLIPAGIVALQHTPTQTFKSFPSIT